MDSESNLSSANASKRSQRRQQQDQALQRFLSKHSFEGLHVPRLSESPSEMVYPIHVAAQQGDCNLLRTMLALGASLDQQTSRQDCRKGTYLFPHSDTNHKPFAENSSCRKAFRLRTEVTEAVKHPQGSNGLRLRLRGQSRRLPPGHLGTAADPGAGGCVCRLKGIERKATITYGSKLNHKITAGFCLCFLLPGLNFGHLFLTHAHLGIGFFRRRSSTP